ncbi:hypothetical protein FRC10_009755 [Ceratobasidium sp. 414]|nr:hypothetical protein FRC10_009755 [Ceratobasidium sp. 414]
MHRFRVRSKSDASKRSVQSVVPPDMPTSTPTPAPAPDPAPLLDLPPASDFRTSLILPEYVPLRKLSKVFRLPFRSLSRRFTLLRSQNGEPLSIEAVRSRLALQRANGHENHVTEEEEEIMIDALIRAHSIDPTASPSDSDQGYVTANGNESTFGGRYDSSELPSPVSSSSKRHSNNMFGSGRVRDQNYIRGATKSNASAAAAPKRSPRKVTLSTASAPVHETQRRRNDPPALELPTDDDEGDQTDVSNLHAVSSPGQGSVTFDTYLSHSTFSPAQIRRASLALQDVIQEFEEGEEEDEKILAPRSGPLNGANQVEPLQDHESHAHHGEGSTGYGEAIAWPNDQSGPQDNGCSLPYNRTVTASPTQRMDTVNRLPGYVPGMHRPITPRDSAVDTDTTGRSSTPQPVSSNPSTPGHEHGPSCLSSPARTERVLPQSVIANKRGSLTNSPLRTRPRQLSTGDQYGDAGGSSSDSTQTPLKSALSDRRRPVSPLVDSAYASNGRSATPSNNLIEAWSPTAVSFAVSNPPSRTAGTAVSAASRDSHLRQASSTSSGTETSDSYYPNQPASRVNGVARSVVSPALPDSPTLNGSSGLANIVSSWNGATTNVIVDEPIHRTPTPSRVVSAAEIGQSTMPSHPFRAPTPSRSPVRVVSGSTPSRTTTPLPRSSTPSLQKRGHSRNGSLMAESAPGGRSSRVAHFHSASGSPSGLRQNPLMMSSILNSSRSSLASTGSSYHSWDEDQLGGKPAHKRGVSVFIDNDTSAWKKHRSGFDVNLGTENAPDPEDIKEVLAGLTKQDVVAVQEKLVTAAVKKRVVLPSVRPLSGQKKRRTSASQSMSSLPSPNEQETPLPFHTPSPVPAAQTPPSPPPNPSPPPFVPTPSTKTAADHAMKANALLHAMMDSIESSPPHTALPPPQPLAPQSSFSSEEPQSTPPTATPPSPTIEPSRDVSDAEPLTPDTPAPEQDPRHKALTDALFGSDSDATVKDSHLSFGRSQSLRAFGMPAVNGAPSPKEGERLLAEEVERRAMAATAALKSPSTPRFTDAGTNGRKSIKKLNTRQISSPQLVSATTSVDTIPLGVPNPLNLYNLTHSPPVGSSPTVEQRAPQPSKLSQRIKKFTGNLRTKTPNPTGDEVSPYVIETSTPPATETSTNSRQMPSFDPPTPSKSPAVTTPVVTTDDSYSSSAPGTPTSAQPRLRGLMARLRKGRKDSTDSRDKGIRAPSPLGPNARPAASPQRAPVPPPPHIPAAMLRAEPIPVPDNFSSSSLGGSGADSPQNVPPPPPPPLPLSAPATIGAQTSDSPPQVASQPQQVDEDAVRQLYDAALHLGLDRAVINDILVRSQSTSSRSTAWTQTQSLATASTSDTPTTPPALPMSSLERSMSVTTPKAPRGSVALGRQLSLKPFNAQPMRAPSPTVGPQPQFGEDSEPKASVVRRTIIFPSPPTRPSSEIARRPSTSKHRRNRSGSVHSNKSVQDRAPTPPPSRAPTNKRFSKDQSPPVPHLPSGLDGSVAAALQLPRSTSGLGSGSNYDSLYDMYTENLGQPDSEAVQSDAAPTGSAVEVLELSDGQIIWSVVDGLRAAGEDDEADDVSPFPYRISRNSEYLAQETHELRFKEHQRTASKGSTLSSTSKPSKGLQSNRPETRVFFSNAGDIGQLVDNLSKSVEAGQFNILPGVPNVPNSHLRPQSGANSAHSFNSSFNSSLPDGDWTIEERIDHMIATSRKRAAL